MLELRVPQSRAFPVVDADVGTAHPGVGARVLLLLLLAMIVAKRPSPASAAARAVTATC